VANTPVAGLPAVIPPRGGIVSFFASVTRGADWILPSHLRIAAALGNVEMDLRHSQIGSGTSEIRVMAVMGNVEITIPAGVRVECDGEPLLGVFDIKRAAGPLPPADAPVVRITGKAILGCVEVRIAGADGRLPPGDHDEDEDDWA
jgi:hypothetical protein